MSFQDFLKGFFGLNQRRNESGYLKDNINELRSPIWGGQDDDDEDDDDDEIEDHFRNVPSSPFGFHIFSGNLLDVHKYFEYQMDEMLKSFRAMESFDFGQGLTEIPQLNPDSPSKSDEDNIRNKYLKPYAECQPSAQYKTDTDLDDRVKTDGLDSLIKHEKIRTSIPQRVFGKSHIKKVIVGPDGRYEEQTTEMTSDGGESTKVTRKIGDQVYSVTTKKDSSGVSEKVEEFINLDEGSLKEFEDKWSSPASKTKRSDEGSLTPIQPPNLFDSPFFKFFR